MFSVPKFSNFLKIFINDIFFKFFQKLTKFLGIYFQKVFWKTWHQFLNCKDRRFLRHFPLIFLNLPKNYLKILRDGVEAVVRIFYVRKFFQYVYIFLAIFRNKITTILTPSTSEGVSGGGGSGHVFCFGGPWLRIRIRNVNILIYTHIYV